ncbi:MAG: hypothetical protein VYB40_06400, partial [Candidatus Thermoplasmatota archaeon]|nr:hypothetical protein [Candidatus Thermoplasmatota archaeon]
HNESVRKALKTPDQDEKLAGSLTEMLLAGGTISFGGSEAGTKPTSSPKSSPGKSPKRRSGAARGNRGRSGPKQE